MKSRVLVAIVLLGAVLLSACNFSLAADITPPPNYKSPTPAPTMGPLFPAQPPSLENGAAIYAEKCAPCHGTTGLGDGPQGKQLSVTVPAFGLPEVGHQAIPADYFTVVTQGRIDKFMPPFIGSLDEQQRWDVVSYALSLHTTADEIAKGQELYTVNCAQCHGAAGSTKFGDASLTDQAFMAKRSENDLFNAISNGSGNMPGFSQLSEVERWTLAAYVRTLTFSAAAPTATPQPPTATPAAISADTTPVATVEGTAQATSEPAATTTPLGVVSGKVIYAGGAVPADLQVKLQGFEHDAQNQNSAPTQVIDQTGLVRADGTYKFENVELIEGRFFTVTVPFGGIDYQAPVVTVSAGDKALAIADLTLFDPTTETSDLKVSQAHVLAQFDGETMQVLVFYILTNTGDKSVLVKTDGKTLPFIPLPEGATALGIDPDQGSQSVVTTPDGFAMPPSANPYGVLAAFSLPYKNKADVKLSIALNIDGGSVLVPEAIKVTGDQLTANGTRDMGDGTTFAVYTMPALTTGDTLSFSLSGKPTSTPVAATTGLTGNQSLLIGIGALGLALILAGVWLYLRDRRQSTAADETDADDEDEEAGEDSEEIMDAIITLDDQYREGHISEEAYQQRRAELKSKLKKLI